MNMNDEKETEQVSWNDLTDEERAEMERNDPGGAMLMRTWGFSVERAKRKNDDVR